MLFIDSTGLGTLVAALTRAKEKGGLVSLVAPTRPVSRLLEIVGINKILKCYPTLDNALSEMKELK